MGLIHPKAPASHNPYLFKGDYRDALDAVDDKGHVPIPQGPGLGVEIDWAWVEKHRTGVLTYE
jgi:L-alanine-DL-glutamate epimerase-like enolase superfamily enzyme